MSHYFENDNNLKEDKKIILYAPTWRGEQYSRPDTDLQDVYKLINVMENSIDTNEYQIFVKLHQIVYHYMKENAMEPGDAQTKFIPATMDTNEILSVTDVLISDYSSIFYDFIYFKIFISRINNQCFISFF